MSVTLDSGFEIAKFSDLRYEGMAVELRYKGVPVAEINKDRGINIQEIELPSRFSPENIQFIFTLDDFLGALNAAKSMLNEL